MEDQSLVRLGVVGNATARLFHGQDVRKVAWELYSKDNRAFLQEGGVITELSYGHTVTRPRGELCVLNPEGIYDVD